jgi:hypothetical protein
VSPSQPLLQLAVPRDGERTCSHVDRRSDLTYLPDSAMQAQSLRDKTTLQPIQVDSSRAAGQALRVSIACPQCARTPPHGAQMGAPAVSATPCNARNAASMPKLHHVDVSRCAQLAEYVPLTLSFRFRSTRCCLPTLDHLSSDSTPTYNTVLCCVGLTVVQRARTSAKKS